MVMQRIWLFMFVLLFSGVSGCSSVPSARQQQSRVQQQEDAMAVLRHCWQQLENPRLSSARRAELTERYNAALLPLLRFYRNRLVEAAGAPVPRAAFDVIYEHDYSLKTALTVYDDFIPAADVRFENLEEHEHVPGLGVPMVGIIPAENVGRTNRPFALRSRGTVSCITALMEFPKKGGRPRLHLLLRSRTECFGRHPLAADFSATIEVYGQMTGLKKGRFLGLLRPADDTQRELTGLSCMESYDPQKIPVILTHGLMSSAATFDNLVNRLMADAEIRRRYQFWFYNYPTGVAWTQTAAHFRASLAEARRRLDPGHRNPRWDRMVLVGHSMGGLITHYSQCTEPWLMLQNSGSLRRESVARYMDARYVDRPFAEPAFESFRSQYYFRPVPAGMVIYLATPHRGAPLARYRITRALTHLIELPQNLVSQALSIVTLQEDMFLLHPEQLTEWFTSVNQLSPTSYSIRGLQGLAVRDVPTHSVIGDRGEGEPRADTSDGVVPYWSSHIGWGGETMVPASHSVQDVAETAECLKTILRDYAKH